VTGTVIDASALLALLLTEPGHERVHAALARSFITTVNLAEVVGHFARHGAHQADIRELLDPLPIERVPFDSDLALAAGLLVPATRPAGLSLGHRACLALAARLDATALTADRAWIKVARATGIEIELIR